MRGRRITIPRARVRAGAGTLSRAQLVTTVQGEAPAPASEQVWAETVWAPGSLPQSVWAAGVWEGMT